MLLTCVSGLTVWFGLLYLVYRLDQKDQDDMWLSEIEAEEWLEQIKCHIRSDESPNRMYK